MQDLEVAAGSVRGTVVSAVNEIYHKMCIAWYQAIDNSTRLTESERDPLRSAALAASSSLSDPAISCENRSGNARDRCKLARPRPQLPRMA